jgi:hypothetical protein
MTHGTTENLLNDIMGIRCVIGVLHLGINNLKIHYVTFVKLNLQKLYPTSMETLNACVSSHD